VEAVDGDGGQAMRPDREDQEVIGGDGDQARLELLQVFRPKENSREGS
jgi:hypothetical protein